MKINHLLPIPIIIFLTLGILRVSSWQLLHDEGVTFEKAFGKINFNTGSDLPVKWDHITSILNNKANHRLTDVIEDLRNRWMHPPVYYLAIHLWTRLFGTQSPALRIPGIIFGVVSLIGIWYLANRVIEWKWAGFWSASLLSASIVFLDYSIYLRPYGLELSIAIWSTYIALLLGFHRNKKKELSLYILLIVLSILGIYTIYHYAFILLWHFCLLFLLFFFSEKFGMVELSKIMIAAFFIIFLYAPWISTLKHHLAITKGRYYFSPFIAWKQWPYNLIAQFKCFIVGYHTKITTLFELGFIFLAIISAILFIKSFFKTFKESIKNPKQLFWFSSITLPVSIIIADYLHNTHTFFIIRTTIIFLPLMILAIVHGVSLITNRFFKVFILALWFFILVFISLTNINSANRNVSDQQALADYILKHDRVTHVVVFNDKEPGYLIPMLEQFREEGVKHIRVIIADRNQLFNIIYKLSKNSYVEHISLVNLDIKYDKNALWTNEDIDRARRILEDAGKTSIIFKVSSKYI